MQIVSAYLLAASAVDSGNYDEYYDLDIDPSFEEYMDIAGDEIVGDYIELDPPNGGTGEFSGNQFCTEWVAAFQKPIEYAQIREATQGREYPYPNAGDSSNIWWTERLTAANCINGIAPSDTRILAKYLDDSVYSQSGHHINFWLACTVDNGVANSRGLGLTGVYLPKSASWQLQSNYPTKGYAEFRLDKTIGSIVTPKIQGGSANWAYVEYSESGTKISNGIDSNIPFILVYNVKVFEEYIKTLDPFVPFLSRTLFALAECNLSKNKR